MRPPVIPDTLRICGTCKNDLTALGEAECAKCRLVTRMALWLLRDPELTGAIATPMEDALYWATWGAMAGGAEFAVPRITEVPAPEQPSRELWRGAPHSTRSQFVRRVMPWLGLVGLLVWTCGWLFGRRFHG